MKVWLVGAYENHCPKSCLGTFQHLLYMVAGFRDEEQARARADECPQTAEAIWKTSGLPYDPQYPGDSGVFRYGWEEWQAKELEFQRSYKAPDCDRRLQMTRAIWPKYAIITSVEIEDAK